VFSSLEKPENTLILAPKSKINKSFVPLRDIQAGLIKKFLEI
jgi:hypothetical protein